MGLGNPGPRYRRTRHNVGFRLVEHGAGKDADWRDFKGLGRYAKRESILLAEPLTFMNESGRFMGSFGRFHKIAPTETLVCIDDVALPLGRLRLRAEGSSGGHKGLESILQHCGGEAIPRLRIGVGPQPPDADSAQFVLAPFSVAEERRLAHLLPLAWEAVDVAVRDGIEAAMNRFNKKDPGPAPTE